jgi:hypothetical protein
MSHRHLLIRNIKERRNVPNRCGFRLDCRPLAAAMVRSACRASKVLASRSRSAASAARALCWPSIAESAAFCFAALGHLFNRGVNLKNPFQGAECFGRVILFQMCKSIV